MKFSERLGFKPLKEQLQLESIDEDLKNSLWTVYLEYVLKPLSNFQKQHELNQFCVFLWMDYFKFPIDTIARDYKEDVHADWLIKYLRQYFFDKINWYEYYDLLEGSIKYAANDDNYKKAINYFLELEKSAYRLVDNQFVQITSKIEIEEIEEAVKNSDKYHSVNTHLNTSLKFLADKKNPDYRNSVKESISAIEAMCKIFTNNSKSTLGDALNQLEKQDILHPSLKKAFSSLYGYTSDDSGIRHALTEKNRLIDFDEAKFMLVTCCSFINYLKSKQTNFSIST